MSVYLQTVTLMPGTDRLAFDLAALSLRLKVAGEGGLVRELSRAIREATPLSLLGMLSVGIARMWHWSGRIVH